MLIYSIGIESLLGGGAGGALVLGNARSVLGEASGATGPISKETWPLESVTCWILCHQY